MRNLPFILVGLLIGAWWLGHVFKQLRSGKLLARGGRVYAKREDNAMLFWSGITIELLVPLFLHA